MRGSLAAVRQAVDAGSQAVEQYGELRAAQVYPKPHGVSVGAAGQRERRPAGPGDRGGSVILGEVVGRVWSERAARRARRACAWCWCATWSPARGASRSTCSTPGTGTTVLVATDEAAAAVTGRSCVDAAVVALVAGWDEP